MFSLGLLGAIPVPLISLLVTKVKIDMPQTLAEIGLIFVNMRSETALLVIDAQPFSDYRSRIKNLRLKPMQLDTALVFSKRSK